MTFRELKEKLEKLSPDQLDEEVKVWAEDQPISSGSFGITDDDWYIDPDDDYYPCFQRRDFSEEEFEQMHKKLVVTKGTPYIWSDL